MRGGARDAKKSLEEEEDRPLITAQNSIGVIEAIHRHSSIFSHHDADDGTVNRQPGAEEKGLPTHFEPPPKSSKGNYL